MGYWSDDMEWIETTENDPEVSFSWKELMKQLQEIPEEYLLQPVTMVDCGGSDIFGVDQKRPVQ